MLSHFLSHTFFIVDTSVAWRDAYLNSTKFCKIYYLYSTVYAAFIFDILLNFFISLPV